MGLPPTFLGVLGLTFNRFWGLTASTARFTAEESSVASTGPAAVLPTADARPAIPPAASSGSKSLLARTWAAAGAFMHRVQAARMRKALREIAQIRTRLHLEEPADALRERPRAVPYY